MSTTYLLEKFDSGMHYIMVDQKTIATIIPNTNTRAICTLNNSVEFHCAIMPKKEGGYFINIGSSICKKLILQQGDTVTATFVVDTTEYQFEMPYELQEVLDTDNEANQIFQSLKKGNQRGLIYLVTQVKSSDKKIERCLKIAEQIKRGVTSPKIILK